MTPHELQELAKIYLADTTNRQRCDKLTTEREQSLPTLRTISRNFIVGETTLSVLREQLDRALRPAEIWYAQGFSFMMEINKFTKNHNNRTDEPAEIFRTLLKSLTPSTVGATIEQFYQYLQRERERLRHEGKTSGTIVAAGNSAYIISLFAFWLFYPDRGITICNDGVRRGLNSFIRDELISGAPGLKLNYTTIEITTASEYKAFLETQENLLRVVPKLDVGLYWAEYFFYWLKGYQQIQTAQLNPLDVEPDDSNSLATVPAKTHTLREVGEEFNWPGRSFVSSTTKQDDPLLIRHEPLMPTPEPLLAHLIRQVQRYILVDEQVVRRIYHALLAGHVILTGPPGTGKTELARIIPEILWQSPINDTTIVTDDEADTPELTTETTYTTRVVTATDEWSPRTLISGVAPQIINGVVTYKIQYGHLTATILKNWSFRDQQPDEWITLLRRTKIIANSNVERGNVRTFRGQWLVIDEFNRAPIDLALGDALTALGGSDVLRVMIENGGNAELPIPRDFRVIGTLNSFDRNYLNQISEALKRRFSFIEILPPTRAQRVSEKGIVLYKALKKISHLSASIRVEENLIIWSEVVAISYETDGHYFESWNDVDHPFYETFNFTWDFFEVIRIYRQLGTAQAISLVQQLLITGILSGYSTTNAWTGQALDNALCDTIADQLQVLLPDEIETLYLYLTTPRERFSEAYNALLASLVDRKQRLYGQLIALNNVCDEAGQPILTNAEVEQIMRMEQPKIEPEKLNVLFHLNQLEYVDDGTYTLPQFTRRLRTFKMERGL